MASLLETRRLSYSYDGKEPVLQEVDLALDPAKTLAVLGGNGAGKSTLFLNLNGVLTPTHGEVCWKGQVVESTPLAIRELRQRVGIVFQDPNDQLFSARIEDDIAFGPLNLGLDEREVRARVDLVVDQLGIRPFIDQPAQTLSFGQKKRVALAGVLAMQPEVLILDEPTAGLDPEGISEMFRLLEQLKKDHGLSLVLATHDIDLVALHCDTALVLDHGRVVFSGPVDALFADPEQLRGHALRMPRIAHLMEIISQVDGLPVDSQAATISQARRSLLGLLGQEPLAKPTLRTGFTTGTCATAATRIACDVLLGDDPAAEQVLVTLPTGPRVTLPVERVEQCGETVICGIRKDAGDDPDVTDGLVIEAAVAKTATGLTLLAGPGVGIVTRPGLACAVGEPAINPVPRQMILEHARQACVRHGYSGGLGITISAPGGEEVARRTFNPRLGIVGGISILGTTGIVEPMSEKALVDTIRVLINQAKTVDPETILLTPGNYGRDFCLRAFGLDVDSGVKIGNYIGETLDDLAAKGFKTALLVGHVGKLVKIAGGIMNTHSQVADARMEILAAHAAAAGADREIVQAILSSTTTRQAIDRLRQNQLDQPVLQSVVDRVKYYCEARVGQALAVEAVLFSAEDHWITQTPGANRLIARLCRNQAAEPAVASDATQSGGNP
jgi:cobalamin biosynthesis protein CbiD